MFFLARAAVCIGLVAVAASHTSAPGLASALDQSVRNAADTAGQACLRSDDCLRVGAGLLAAAPLSVVRHEVGWDRGEDRVVLAAQTVPLPPSRPVGD